MKRPPAFQFYPKDWRSSATVRQMSRAEKGDLIELLAASWDQDPPGSLPLPVQLAAKSAGLDPRVVRSLIAKFPKLWIEIDGRLVNPKLRAQWEELQQRQQKLSDAGKRGNEARWQDSSGGDSGGDSQGESGGNRSASASASATASATASAKQQGGTEPPCDSKELASLIAETQSVLRTYAHLGKIPFDILFTDFKGSAKALGVDWRRIEERIWPDLIRPFQTQAPVVAKLPPRAGTSKTASTPKPKPQAQRVPDYDALTPKKRSMLFWQYADDCGWTPASDRYDRKLVEKLLRESFGSKNVQSFDATTFHAAWQRIGVGPNVH